MTLKEAYIEERSFKRPVLPIVASLAIAIINADCLARRMRQKGKVFTEANKSDMDELRRDVEFEVYIAVMLSTPHLERDFEAAYRSIANNPIEWWWARREWSIGMWRAQLGVPRG